MASKPLHNEKMTAKRLEFANQYQLWGVEEWKKVMFCEESHFELRFDNQANPLQEADRVGPLLSQVHQKDVEAPTEGGGLGL